MMAISMGVLMAAASLMYDAPTGMEVKQTLRSLQNYFSYTQFHMNS